MVVLIPGWGGDRRMYAGPWLSLPEVRVLELPAPGSWFGPVSVAGLARCFAEQLSGKSVQMIVGSSMGGMIGLRLAELLAVKRVVLVGSTLDAQEINPWLRSLIELAPLCPWQAMQRLAGCVPNTKLQMFSGQSMEFLLPLLADTVRWRYRGHLRPWRIHGRRDPVIRARRADVWLPATHVVAMEHPHACVAAIRRWLDESGRERT